MPSQRNNSTQGHHSELASLLGLHTAGWVSQGSSSIGMSTPRLLRTHKNCILGVPSLHSLQAEVSVYGWLAPWLWPWDKAKCENTEQKMVTQEEGGREGEKKEGRPGRGKMEEQERERKKYNFQWHTSSDLQWPTFSHPVPNSPFSYKLPNGYMNIVVMIRLLFKSTAS